MLADKDVSQIPLTRPRSLKRDDDMAIHIIW